MAHSVSAKKRIRQNAKKRLHNKAIRSAIATQVKKLHAAIASGNTEQSRAHLTQTVIVLDKAASKGLIHKNAASRSKSRLTRKVNAISAGTSA